MPALSPLQRLGQWLDARRLHTPRPLPARATGVLSVSFDDFPRTAWTEGGAVLAAHGVKGTYFACGGLCGRSFLDLAQFNALDLQAASEAGHEIGCHSFSHLSARHVRLEAYRADLDANAAFLQERLGQRAETFAYPYGFLTPAAQLLAVSRYRAARGVYAGLEAGQAADHANLKAIGFETRQMARHDLPALIAAAAAAKGWLILFTHDVQDRPSPYGCTPRALDEVLAAARRAGLEIRPVRDALAA